MPSPIVRLRIHAYAASPIAPWSSSIIYAIWASSGDGVSANLVISEKDLHDGFEYIIARHKKEIEENRYATTEQKEVEKNIRELILKSIEEQINVYLKSQNRLL